MPESGFPVSAPPLYSGHSPTPDYNLIDKIEDKIFLKPIGIAEGFYLLIEVLLLLLPQMMLWEARMK